MTSDVEHDDVSARMRSAELRRRRHEKVKSAWHQGMISRLGDAASELSDVCDEENDRKNLLAISQVQASAIAGYKGTQASDILTRTITAAYAIGKRAKKSDEDVTVERAIQVISSAVELADGPGVVMYGLRQLSELEAPGLQETYDRVRSLLEQPRDDSYAPERRVVEQLEQHINVA